MHAVAARWLRSAVTDRPVAVHALLQPVHLGRCARSDFDIKLWQIIDLGHSFFESGAAWGNIVNNPMYPRPAMSGSSQINAKPSWFGGTPSHFNAGDTSPPSSEFPADIGWLFLKLVLLIVNFDTVSSRLARRYRKFLRSRELQPDPGHCLHTSILSPKFLRAQVPLAILLKPFTLCPASGMTRRQVGARQPEAGALTVVWLEWFQMMCERQIAVRTNSSAQPRFA